MGERRHLTPVPPGMLPKCCRSGTEAVAKRDAGDGRNALRLSRPIKPVGILSLSGRGWVDTSLGKPQASPGVSSFPRIASLQRVGRCVIPGLRAPPQVDCRSVSGNSRSMSLPMCEECLRCVPSRCSHSDREASLTMRANSPLAFISRIVSSNRCSSSAWCADLAKAR